MVCLGDMWVTDKEGTYCRAAVSSAGSPSNMGSHLDISGPAAGMLAWAKLAIRFAVEG